MALCVCSNTCGLLCMAFEHYLKQYWLPPKKPLLIHLHFSPTPSHATPNSRRRRVGPTPRVAHVLAALSGSGDQQGIGFLKPTEGRDNQ